MLLEDIQDCMTDGKVVALGELGLDYDRIQFCDIETQKAGFLDQLRLAHQNGLPIFFHSRNTEWICMKSCCSIKINLARLSYIDLMAH